jgi:lipopolysaccharide biosynthesis glycosyltransferase
MEFEIKLSNEHMDIIKLKRYQGGIPVCYCFDRAYANYTAVSSYSLHVNSPISPRIFWVVPSDDFEYSLDLLNSVNKIGMDITLIKVNLDHFKDWKGHKTTYYRLLLPILLDIDKVIYIDSDTIVMSDLTEIFNHDLKDKLVGGVIDPGGHTSNIYYKFQNIEPYINAGLLVMNLKLMRELNFTDACKRIYYQFVTEMNYGDQDIINLAAYQRKIILDDKFCRLMQINDETNDSFNLAVSNNHVLHFVGAIKPWMKCCSPKPFAFWWKFASKLNIKDLLPLEINSVQQVIFLAQALHLNGEFQEASFWKSKAIEILIRR